jgi:N-acetyl sugar amidotransferase
MSWLRWPSVSWPRPTSPLENRHMTLAGRRVCTRCVYDETLPGITFDGDGVCNYCAVHDQMVRQYPVGEQGERELRAIADRIRAAGKGKKFDCIVGVSGGCDSSYMLWKMVELGLRPLAVHFDNTWNSPIATQNIYNVLEKLGVELSTLVVNNKEFDDLSRSFLLSGVKDIDITTDIGLTTTLYRAAEKHDVKYIIEGHSFRTEGVAPLGWVYMDGKYIQSVHDEFGSRPMKTFPNLWLKDFLRFAAVRNIRRIRPLYFMDYNKDDAKRFLSEELNWQWYGGHHLENRWAAFVHTYFWRERYGIDGRLLGHAALVRSGQLDREQALTELETPAPVMHDVLELVQKRLGFSTEEFAALMSAPHKTYADYPTYKKTFERLRPLFWLLYKADRVPKSFYTKFTLPDPGAQRAPVAPDAVGGAEATTQVHGS